MSEKSDREKSRGSFHKVVDYLFGKDPDSKYLDTRTDISGREMFNAIAYYRGLNEGLASKNAEMIAGILERLSISTSREGRKEGVTSLQNIMSPMIEIMQKGYERGKLEKPERDEEVG